MCHLRYLFDRWGTYLGRIDASGAYFDAEGRLVGRVVGGRDVFDCDGVPCGRIDGIGQYWNESGRFLGYVRPTVRDRSVSRAS